MSQFELKKVTTDTEKIYKPSDNFVFNLTFNCKSAIDDDVEFEIAYIGDAYSDSHDQRICHNVIGPLQEGLLSFDLETTPIDLTKIPIKTLFGITTILIVGKFRGKEFIRIGYVINVEYPGIEADKLQDSDDKPLGEDEEIEAEVEENSEEVSDEDVEILEDEDLDEEPCCSDENCDNSQCGIEEEEECDEDDECCDENGECCNEYGGLEDALANVLMPKNNRKPIPLVTPIVAGQDDFVYRDIKMKQSLIKLTLLKDPMVYVFDIDWAKSQNPEGENFKESSEDEEPASKKVKKNN